MNLIKNKRRMGHGTEVLLDYTKAKEKMRMFITKMEGKPTIGQRILRFLLRSNIQNSLIN